MAIARPQVLVFQEFSLTPAEIIEALRAHISGPNAMLHRYANAEEKPLINLGAYDRNQDVCYPWPGRQAGSKVDEGYTRLFVDNAMLMYFEDMQGDFSGGRGTVTAVAGRTNWIRSSSVSFKANGTNFPRSALLNDRDVKVGDKVWLRGIADVTGDCDEIILNTYVTGFAADEVAGEVQDCRADLNNAATQTASTEINQTRGPFNCISATANGAGYDGLPDGFTCETYTIDVVASSIAGCQAARLRITSASGTDDQEEVQPEDFGAPTDIGTRGLQVTFLDNALGASCSSEASAHDAEPVQLVFGQRWVVSVCQTFEKTCCEARGTYSGDQNDVYIIEVTKGGTFADLPAVTCTTVKGLDLSGPTEVTGPNVEVAVGTHGVGILFTDCFGSSSSCSSTESGNSECVPLGDGTLTQGLRKGDKFYITVLSPQQGPLRTLILKHDVPKKIREAEDLDLRLFIAKDGLEITEDRLSNPPLVNWEQETTQFCVIADITAYDATWTHNGVELPLPLWEGTLYVQYREWLFDLTDEVGTIQDVAQLDQIPGPLDPDNPLKYGVFKALQNTGGDFQSQTAGVTVKYTAVADPDSLDSWQNVIERVDGREDIYMFVPLTHDREVMNLFQAHVNNESTPDAGNWKGMFVNLQAVTSKMIVGQSSANAQLLHPTSTDGEIVLATLDDDPEATGTQYTRLQCESDNGGFITYGVRPGDILRFLFTVDAFGNESYREFVVDQVLSEGTLLLLEGYGDPISEPQRIEIWHTQEKDEIVADLKEQAQAFGDRRVCAVWPDLVGVGGVTVDGYYVCCALAGLASGVAPHAGLTNVEVKGFDDFSRSTKFFNGSQLDELQDGGVWIVTEDQDGTPHTYHALNTNVLTVEIREEMVRRNVDSMSYLFRRRLAIFIGRTNVTPSMLEKLRAETQKVLDFLMTNGFTEELGPQLIEGTIRDGFPRIHPLIADRVEIVVDLNVPVPLNNIELHLVV